MMLRPLSYSLSSPLGGQLGARVGERRAAILGHAGLAGAMALFTVAVALEVVPLIGIALVVQGVGNGFSRPGLTAIVANSVDESDLGLASASQRMFQMVGNAFGIAVLTAVYGGVETSGAFARAYAVAFLLGLVSVAAATRIARSDPDAAPALPVGAQDVVAVPEP